jgi:hypothetical protein
MLVQGLQPVQPGARPVDQPLQLHLNQKVTAEILSVNGEQIEMVIQGYRVVGRLQTNDQSATLENNQLAQFIVKGSIDGVLQLAIAKSSEIAAPAQPTSKLSLLAQNLLILNNIEVTDQNIILGKALDCRLPPELWKISLKHWPVYPTGDRPRRIWPPLLRQAACR